MTATPTAPRRGLATDRQINYLMHLLAQRGYSTRFMNARYKELGATMRQRSGTVRGWLESLTIAEASVLIDRLRK